MCEWRWERTVHSHSCFETPAILYQLGFTINLSWASVRSVLIIRMPTLTKPSPWGCHGLWIKEGERLKGVLVADTIFLRADPVTKLYNCKQIGIGCIDLTWFWFSFHSNGSHAHIDVLAVVHLHINFIRFGFFRLASAIRLAWSTNWLMLRAHAFRWCTSHPKLQVLLLAANLPV